MNEIECTWIAKDDCGNETSITITVRITDNTDPIITNVPADMTVDCDEDIPAAVDPDVEEVLGKVVERDGELAGTGNSIARVVGPPLLALCCSVFAKKRDAF